MFRNTHRLSLSEDRPHDGLSNPPGGIGGELGIASIIKLVNGTHQTKISFLDQIKKVQLLVVKFLRNRDHQTKIRLNDCVSNLVSAKFERLVLLQSSFQLLQIRFRFQLFPLELL